MKSRNCFNSIVRITSISLILSLKNSPEDQFSSTKHITKLRKINRVRNMFQNIVGNIDDNRVNNIVQNRVDSQLNFSSKSGISNEIILELEHFEEADSRLSVPLGVGWSVVVTVGLSRKVFFSLGLVFLDSC